MCDFVDATPIPASKKVRRFALTDDVTLVPAAT
jgi:hypothetical protein